MNLFLTTKARIVLLKRLASATARTRGIFEHKNIRAFQKNLSERAFTLVEVLVSVAIFTMIMLMATGAVFTIVNANKKMHSLKSVMTNLNFALESMSREMRVGKDFKCLGSSGSPVSNDGDNGSLDNCINGNVGFSFTSNKDFDNNDTGDTIIYSFNSSDGRIYQWHQCIVNNPGCNSSPIPITADEINIINMKFHVIGTNDTDGLQPRVLITVSGSISQGSNQTTFNIQTTASQRLVDLE